jgi:2'-5' RNA ligase
MYLTAHQLKQIEVINTIERQIKEKAIIFTTVSPVADYHNDQRMALTSVHMPRPDFIHKVITSIIEPLKKVEPDFYYYTNENLHMTVKNVRVINDPPHFTDKDIEKAAIVFNSVIPQHSRFNVYFYRLLLFPNNVSLIGTTDEELDKIILDLSNGLNKAGVPDDKVFANSSYFFSNMTLARFNKIPSDIFKQKVEELSGSISYEPYEVDSVTLLTCNAVLQKKSIAGQWNLH